MTHQIFALTWKEIKLLLGDPYGLVTLFALPLIFIAVMTAAQASAFDAVTGEAPLALLVVNQDGSALAHDLLADLQTIASLHLTRQVDGQAITRAQAEAWVTAGRYPIALVLPVDFSAQVLADPHTATPAITLLVDPTASLPLVTAAANLIHGSARRTIAYARLPAQIKATLWQQLAGAPPATAPLTTTQPVVSTILADQLAFFLENYTRQSFLDAITAQAPPPTVTAQVMALYDDLLVRGVPGQIKPFVDNTVQNLLTELPSGQLAPPHADKLRLVITPPAGLVAEKRPDAVQQNVPAWTIFGVFFIVQTLATALLREKTGGTARRLQLAPLAPGVLLVGSVLPYYLVNLTQIGLMFAVGGWGFGLQLGHAPGALLLITACTAGAALGLGLCVAAFARTPAQVNGIALLLITALAALGGMMVARIFMPKWMQALTHLTPHAWALDGYQDVLVRGLGLRAVLPEAAVLTAFALGCFLLARWRLRLTND